MDKEEYIRILQSDEEELRKYMERSKWHVLKVQELDIENKKMKATLKHLKVHGEFIRELLEDMEVK